MSGCDDDHCDGCAADMEAERAEELERRCQWPDCTRDYGRTLDGLKYCDRHFRRALEAQHAGRSR